MTSNKSTIKDEYERRKKAEKKAHFIVEQLIEDDVEIDQFLSAIKRITGQHYSDIVEERSLSNLCGYCLCKHKLKQTLKQQYKINKNKVYDITERKKFCSNQCYAISCHIFSQISSTPLWLRNPDLMPDILIPEIDKSTVNSADGEEVHLTHIISKKEVESLNSIEITDSSNESTAPNTEYQNLMNVPGVEGTKVLHKQVHEQEKQLNIADEAFEILQQWMTPYTLQYLGIIETTEQHNVPSDSEVSSREMKLQKQLDRLILGESSTNEEPSKPVPDYKALKDEVNHFEDRVASFYEGSLNVKERQHKKKKTENKSEAEGQIEPSFPTVDSKNQEIIRQKIVLDHIRKIIDDLTPPLPNVMQECHKLIKSFRFSNTNVMLSIELWPVMTIAILNLLSIKSLHLLESLQSPVIERLFDTLLKPCNMTSRSINTKILAIAKNL